MQDPLRANLAALAARQPELAARIAAAEPWPLAGVAVAPTGDPSFCLRGPEGEIWLHSRFDPRAEAKTALAEIPPESFERIVIGGLGLGYVAQALAERWPARPLLVIEPDLRLLRAALQTRDLAGLLAHPMLEIAAPAAKGDLTERVGRFEHADLVRGFRYVRHLYLKRRAALYEPFLDEFADMLRMRSMQITSGMSGSRTTIANVLANVGTFAASRGIAEFAGKFAGVPGILVGAGPSLARNMPVLKQAEGKAVIFAVSTALKPVLDAGIKPTCTGVVDYHADSARYFAGIGPQQAPLLFGDPRANPAVYAAWQGETATNAEAYLQALLHDSGLPGHGSIPEGNTVAHHAFFVLQALGCNPIILVGMDLGYPSYITHVPRTAIYDEWQANTGPFSTFENQEMHFVMRYRRNGRRWQDVHGNTIWSDRMMEAYAIEFRRIIRAAPQRVVHAVEGGVDLGCHEVCTLAEAVQRYCTKPASLDELTRPLPELERASRLTRAAEALQRRLHELDEFREIQRDCMRTLRAAGKRLLRGELYLDDLREKLQRLEENSSHLEFLREALLRFAAADAVVRLRNEMEAQAKGGEQVVQYRRLVERETDYLRGMERAAQDLRERIELALRALQPLAPAGAHA